MCVGGGGVGCLLSWSVDTYSCDLTSYTLFLLSFLLQTFAKAFGTTPDDLDMHIIYDVSHNIAKIEEHISCSASGVYLCSAMVTHIL